MSRESPTVSPKDLRYTAHLAVTGPPLRSVLAITGPPLRSVLAITGPPLRSVLAITGPPLRSALGVAPEPTNASGGCWRRHRGQCWRQTLHGSALRRDDTIMSTAETSHRSRKRGGFRNKAPKAEAQNREHVPGWHDTMSPTFGSEDYRATVLYFGKILTSNASSEASRTQ